MYALCDYCVQMQEIVVEVPVAKHTVSTCHTVMGLVSYSTTNSKYGIEK